MADNVVRRRFDVGDRPGLTLDVLGETARTCEVTAYFTVETHRHMFSTDIRARGVVYGAENRVYDFFHLLGIEPSP